MIKKYDFIEKTIYIIKKKLEKNLPQEAILEEMIDKTKELIKEIFK
jgi:hypothetical protein